MARPHPVNAAHARYGHSGNPGWLSNPIVLMVGMASTAIGNTVQFRPPKVAIPSEYGMRRQAQQRWLWRRAGICPQRRSRKRRRA
ncbi:putative nitrite extrusion domain protein [Mycobacterium ulcerans str. Harvey]|uniref:Nitrite extrusion domain protein n=1 Tax=Mycobacterium ulcerans str. Harvey TaxID=1299332 RepID=A0ABN0R3H4_MYCUL|nr:putative nitrite extrusion domain protein [Mycobacterium ulcerans str. Harvey]